MNRTIPYQELNKLKFPFGTTTRLDWIVIIVVGSLVGIALCLGKDIRFSQYILPPALILYCLLNFQGDRNLLKSLKKDLLNPHASNTLLWKIYQKKINYPPRMKQQISLDALRNPLDLFLVGRLIQIHAQANQEQKEQEQAEAMIETAVSYAPELQTFVSNDNLGDAVRSLEAPAGLN